MPPQTQVIPAEIIGSSQQQQPVSPPPVTDRAGLLRDVETGIGQIDSDLKSIQEKRDTTESDVSKLLSGIGGQEDYRRQLEDQAGLDELESQLSSINSQVRANNRLNPARLLAEEQSVIGTGVTKSSLATRLSNTERDNAIQSLTLAAEADIAQGRYDAANTRIDRAMNAKFEPMKQELEVQKFNLQRLDDRVKSGEVRLDAKQQAKFNLQVGQIEKAEEDLKVAQDLTKELFKNGAPESIRSQALQAQSVGDVLKIPGIGTYLRSQEEKLREALLGEQLSKARYENQETRNALEKAARGEYVPTGKEDYVTGGFAKRMHDASQIIAEAEKNGTTVPLHILANPRRDNLLSPAQRELAQAQRDFIAAKLRKESGAAIADSEVRSEAAILFPRVKLVENADGTTNYDQYSSTRETAINSLISESKGGFESLVQDEINSTVNPPATEVARTQGFDEAKLRQGAKQSGFPTFTNPSDGKLYYKMPDGTIISVE